jgi:short-subunit dehydrogenase
MNYTLITGASSGIGEALAFRCAQEGFNLILLGRDQEKLQRIAAAIREKHECTVQLLCIDLLSPDAAQSVYQQCRRHEWHVRILINNAGIGMWGRFEQLSLEETVDMMQLNQQLMVQLTHFFIPMLKEVPYAHILNVSSTAAFQPLPYFSVYAAGKSFVLSFSRALRHEMEIYGINVSCLSPGPTATAFFSRAGYHKIVQHQRAVMKASEVADDALQGLIRKQAVIVPGFSNRLGRVMSKVLPHDWMSSILGRIFQPQ